MLKYIARDQKDNEGEEAKNKERKDVNETTQVIHQEPQMANERKNIQNLCIVNRINGTLITLKYEFYITEAFIAITFKQFLFQFLFIKSMNYCLCLRRYAVPSLIIHFRFLRLC